MIVHIFNRETVYSHQYLKLLGNYFDVKNEHLFVFRSKKTFKKFDYQTEVSKKIIYVDSWYKFIFRLYPLLKQCDKIVIHFLSIGPSLFFWFTFSKLLRKALWVQWGSDLYFYRRDKTLLKHIYERLRKIVIPKIDSIACIPREDYELTRRIYKTDAKYFNAFYPNPVGYDKLDFVPNDLTRKKKKKILVGNSANASNNHLEVLEALKNIPLNNTQIICPLAYGATQGYVNQVVRKGKNYFGEHFIYFLERQPPDEYIHFLAGIDIAIMNHKRKQGLGTGNLMLYFGKKVFIRNE